MSRKLEEVKGHKIAAPHLTATGYWYAFLYIFLPIMGVFTALDLLIYAIFYLGFGECYSVFCWI